MNTCIIDKLLEKNESFDKYVYNKKCILEYNKIKPFILFQNNGSLFSINSFSKKCCNKSPFFMLKSINPDKNCAVLESLIVYPCRQMESAYKDIKGLFRTNMDIVIDLSCFCGILFLNALILDCLITCDVSKNVICFPFELKNTESVYNIWNSEETNNIATIKIHYTKGIDPEIIGVIKTLNETVFMHVPQKSSRVITVTGVSSVDIFNSIMDVQGTIEILFNRIENEKVYFGM
ncbi:CotZ-related putative spore coat protein [Bacillus thuringiensis]|uniref:CotZ-related putative spore coat protein n=1 Tax=Bacillus thuringiensis TaxID=1428 RepID=UPI00345A13AE